MQVERRAALLCSKFEGYSRTRLYSLSEIMKHAVAVVYNFDNTFDLYVAAQSNVVFLKMHKLDLYVSLETPTRFEFV